ncbi:hypothetical protein D3C79_829920 [compost metagenome]
MLLQRLEELVQAVLGQAIGVGRPGRALLVQRAALHAVFEAGASDQHLPHTGLDHLLDEAVVGHQVLLQVEQCLVVGQPRPGQVSQRIDAVDPAGDLPGVR